MTSQNWAKTCYLDASAIVKLVVDEPDAASIRDYFDSNANFCTSLLCVCESLGICKGKWSRGEISAEGYVRATKKIVTYARTSRIEIDDLGLAAATHQGVEELGRKHGLDLSDALQLYTILHGKYSHPGPGSASILISADGGLCAAAISEGIRAWNCASEPRPAWA